MRRWCAPLLDLPRHASPAAYLERRNSLHITEVSRTFLMASGIHTFLVDGGFQPERLLSGSELASLAGAVSLDVVRLEHTVELSRLTRGQLAVLPGTNHVSYLIERPAWLLEMIVTFLDAPVPEGN